MADNDEGLTEARVQKLPTKVADTGATVVCGGRELMQEMGLELEQLLPTT